jgi:hypothetical protein
MAPGSRRDVLLELAEAGVRVALRLADGSTREGWIDEVEDDAIVFEHAPSPFYAQATGTDEMAPPAERIGIAEIIAYVGEGPGWRSFPEADGS